MTLELSSAALVPQVLQAQLFDNSLRAWLTAVVTTAVIFVLLVLLRRLVVSRLSVLAARTSTQFDDMALGVIQQTRTWVLLAVAIFFGIRGLEWPDTVSHYLDGGARLVLLWQVGLWGASAIAFWAKNYLGQRTTSGDHASIAMIGAMSVGAKVILWALIILTAVRSVFGIEITALITGLGVGGIAVALAVQNILGDLLAALAIVFDKPFDVGDFITVDQVAGSVERIGLKTTRVRSLAGEQIILGNADLLKSRVHNYRRMYQRRVVLTFNMTYDTPKDVLAKLPGIAREIISAQSPVKFDRAHVSNLADWAIAIEAVYYVLDPDYTRHMDIQQAILLEALRRFEAAGAQFAYPTQTLYHEGVGKDA
ncbi:MAG TPA: mechanosensitive ion channel domain-containing protein [Gemmatimonadaceae bacterium]|nr:mechanosensitive ion channel domain-containing protein [Gemmatimonadaceae bacterium]